MFSGVVLDVFWGCTGCFLELHWMFPGVVKGVPGFVLDVSWICTGFFLDLCYIFLELYWMLD